MNQVAMKKEGALATNLFEADAPSFFIATWLHVL